MDGFWRIVVLVDEVAFSTCLIASLSSALHRNASASVLAMCAMDESACLSIGTCLPAVFG